VEIAPDTKDWTWVLDRPCPECGFDTRTVEPPSIADRLRAVADAWVGVLGGAGVRTRPAPEVWSPLEYGCHVRDAFGIYDQRLGLMLTEDDPLYPNWDQDETAVAGRYGEQDPATVAAELRAGADTLAAHFDQVRGGQWDRPGARGDGARFTVASFGRYFLHDPVHHLYDATGRRAG
jgi:hypothetical protein